MRLLYCFAACVLACVNVAAHADPVTYTLTGTFSGTVGALSFTDVSGTITQISDTTGTDSLGAGFYTNTDGLSSITLDGIGTAVFLSPTFGAESQFDGAGFFDLDNGFGSSVYDPALGYYTLTAPFSDTAYLETSFAASLGTTELTSLGELSLTGDDGTSATFTADSPVGTAVTPEPSSFLLLGTGLLGAGMFGVVGAIRQRIPGVDGFE